MVCWDLTLSGSLFHSTWVAMAKPHLPMAHLGLTEEADISMSQSMRISVNSQLGIPEHCLPPLMMIGTELITEYNAEM